MNNNKKLFTELRSLGLPSGEYAVTASGPLGIRGLRDITDIDLLVTTKLWNNLAKKFTVNNEGGVKKIKISNNIEAVYEKSFENPEPNSPSIPSQIANAEIIEGLPFVNLQDILFFKNKSKKDKDKRDVELINDWIKKNS